LKYVVFFNNLSIVFGASTINTRRGRSNCFTTLRILRLWSVLATFHIFVYKVNERSWLPILCSTRYSRFNNCCTILL